MMLVEYTTQIVKLLFKTTMLKLGLCDYSDAYILVKETIIIKEEQADVVAT